MRQIIQNWYAWLKEAVSTEEKEATAASPLLNAGIYSDGRQLWATDGYRLHARQVALAKKGTVTLNEEGLFAVEEHGTMSDFASILPRSEAKASIVVERDKLLQALAGQDKHVRLTLFTADPGVELSSAGAYALIMPIDGLDEEDFWRPKIGKA